MNFCNHVRTRLILLSPFFLPQDLRCHTQATALGTGTASGPAAAAAAAAVISSCSKSKSFCLTLFTPGSRFWFWSGCAASDVGKINKQVCVAPSTIGLKGRRGEKAAFFCQRLTVGGLFYFSFFFFFSLGAGAAILHAFM